jgi:hypothetical protein
VWCASIRLCVFACDSPSPVTHPDRRAASLLVKISMHYIPISTLPYTELREQAGYWPNLDAEHKAALKVIHVLALYLRSLFTLAPTQEMHERVVKNSVVLRTEENLTLMLLRFLRGKVRSSVGARSRLHAIWQPGISTWRGLGTCLRRTWHGEKKTRSTYCVLQLRSRCWAVTQCKPTDIFLR